MADWLRDIPGGCVVTVRVIPRAGRTELAGERGGALLVRIARAPIDGAANDALLALLADHLDVARRELRIVSGERGRLKRVAVSGPTEAEVTRRLAPDAGRG